MPKRTRVSYIVAGLIVLVTSGASADPTNVSWTIRDSITACPAGDSVAAGRPSRLRMIVTYAQLAGGLPVPRVGAPPESIWVTWTGLSGNAQVNDQAGRANADDSTNTQGVTRITLPSLSGCGALAVSVWVAGELQGSASITVRSADSDLDGRSTVNDAACDFDYDGDSDGVDAALAAAHAGHFHRQALFGTMVRRTTLNGVTGPIGESSIAWSPDARDLAFTIHTPPSGDCAVFLVRSDPVHGNALTQFTFPEEAIHDYDPSWSPLGTEIAFGRSDNAIFVKGIPGINPDTSLRLVTRHNDGSPEERGDLMPAISPEGVWVAFARKSTSAGNYEIWKTPISGDTTQRVQLTFETDADDQYPQWSTDGTWILYQRYSSGGRYSAWKVPAAGGTPVPVLESNGGTRASTPAFAPDGAVILAGVGPSTGAIVHTMDAALTGLVLPSASLVAQFPAFTRAGAYPGLTPRMSPDGTRLALSTSNIFAARRNMSLPPSITAVAGQSIDDRTPFVNVAVVAGTPLSFDIAVSDPEGDAIDCQAFFMQAGMNFDPLTRTFSWTPALSAVGTTTHVRFQIATASGGSDYAIVRISVAAPVNVPPAAAPAQFRVRPAEPNPFRERSTLRFELPGAARVRVEIFDLGGRRLRTLRDAPYEAGVHAVDWDGRGEGGASTAPGLYLCRVSAGMWSGQVKLLRVGE